MEFMFQGKTIFFEGPALNDIDIQIYYYHTSRAGQARGGSFKRKIYTVSQRRICL